MRDNLKRLVDYAANPDKTEYSGLAKALHYAENDAKTAFSESVQLVSGIHCRPARAWAQMRAVQEQFGKTGGVVAYHAYKGRPYTRRHRLMSVCPRHVCGCKDISRRPGP